MDEAAARELIRDHFASGGRDEARASRIYADNAVLEFPQGGERIRGKANIMAMRIAYPASLDFEMGRTIGCGDVWVNEYTIRYDGRPSHVVGIMEFRDGLVVRETVYISDSWEPPAWRAEWVETITPPAD
jgi:SnoaL-like domain